MAEYIERTEELVLAVNAGARAIEHTKKYHGASYCIDVFAENPREIPYLKAVEVLRGFDEIPAADVAPVVRCRECKHITPVEGGLPLCTLHNIARAYNDFCSDTARMDGE